MGYGSAMAWFMLLIIAFFTALIFRSSSAWVIMNRKEGKTEMIKSITHSFSAQRKLGTFFTTL